MIIFDINMLIYMHANMEYMVLVWTRGDEGIARTGLWEVVDRSDGQCDGCGCARL